MLRNLRLLLSYIRRQFRYSALRGDSVSIDPSAIVLDSVKLAEFSAVYREAYVSECSIGRLSYIGPRAIVTNADLGSFCSIGSGVRIGPGYHPTKWISSHPAFYSNAMQAGRTFVSSKIFQDTKRTTLGSDVWVGANAIVLDGVSIGHGAVVAAGAVVTADIPPYAIVGGVPAKLIRMRFDQKKIDDLLTWKWWELPLDSLEILGKHFRNDESWSVDYLIHQIDSHS